MQPSPKGLRVNNQSFLIELPSMHGNAQILISVSKIFPRAQTIDLARTNSNLSQLSEIHTRKFLEQTRASHPKCYLDNCVNKKNPHTNDIFIYHNLHNNTIFTPINQHKTMVFNIDSRYYIYLLSRTQILIVTIFIENMVNHIY